MAAAISMPVQVTAGGVQATVGTLAISPTADGHIAENDVRTSLAQFLRAVADYLDPMEVDDAPADE
jgi:hypothetical protein